MALILDYNYNTNTHIMGVFLIFKKKFQILTSNKKQMIKYLYLCKCQLKNVVLWPLKM